MRIDYPHPHPPSPSSLESVDKAGGSASASAVATVEEPAIAVGEDTLKEKSLDHLAMQLLLSVIAAAAYVVFARGLDTHWGSVPPAYQERLPAAFRARLRLLTRAYGAFLALVVLLFSLRRRFPERVQKKRRFWAWIIVFMHGLTLNVFSFVSFLEWTLAPGLNCGGAEQSVQACGRSFFFLNFASATMLMYYMAQFPVAVMLVPEISRCTVYVVLNLYLVHKVTPGGVTRQFVLELLAQAGASSLLGPIGLAICTDTGSASYVFQDLQTCPSFMLPLAAWVEALGQRVRQELFLDKPLLDGNSAMVVVAGYTVVCAEVLLGQEAMSIAGMCEQLLKVVMVALAGSAAAKLRPTSTAALDDMAQRLGLASQQQARGPGGLSCFPPSLSANEQSKRPLNQFHPFIACRS